MYSYTKFVSESPQAKIVSRVTIPQAAAERLFTYLRDAAPTASTRYLIWAEKWSWREPNVPQVVSDVMVWDSGNLPVAETKGDLEAICRDLSGFGRSVKTLAFHVHWREL